MTMRNENIIAMIIIDVIMKIIRIKITITITDITLVII